jgi:hypothetical protein
MKLERSICSLSEKIARLGRRAFFAVRRTTVAGRKIRSVADLPQLS